MPLEERCDGPPAVANRPAQAEGSVLHCDERGDYMRDPFGSDALILEVAADQRVEASQMEASGLLLAKPHERDTRLGREVGHVGPEDSRHWYWSR